MNGFNGADQPVFKTGVLFFDKSRQLRVRRCPPQGYNERFDYGEDDSGDQAKPQCDNGPTGNAGRLRKHKADQEQGYRHAQDPRQTPEPQERLPTTSYECDLPEQFFMWCHSSLLTMSGCEYKPA